MLTRQDGQADHAAVLLDGKLYDFDGPLEPAAFADRFNTSELASCVSYRPIKKGNLPGAFHDGEISWRIAQLLREGMDSTPKSGFHR